MLTKEELPACPVATTVQMIGSKWKLLIMRNLLQRPWRFNELKKDLEGISQKVLTDSLRSMEADGIITRTVYPEVPPRVEYALSDLGESMRPIMDAMEIWGTEYKKSKEEKASNLSEQFDRLDVFMVIRIRLISSMENVAPLSAGRESIFSIRLPTSLQSVPMARLLLHHTSQCILHSRRNVIIPGNLLKQQLPCRPKIPAWQLFFILYVF